MGRRKKEKEKPIKDPTPKQQRLIKLLAENVGTKKPKTLGEILILAGYSKNVSRSPSHIIQTKGIQANASDFVKMLDDKRKLALSHITEKKIKKSNAKDLAHVTDLLTKNHQLLTGGETERVKGSIIYLPAKKKPE